MRIILYFLIVLLGSCSFYRSTQPAQGCLNKCKDLAILCVVLLQNSLPKTPPESYNNAQIIQGTCSPDICNSKCRGQALASYQQSR